MYVSSLVVHPVNVLFLDTARGGLPDNPLLIEGHPAWDRPQPRRAWLALALLAALA